MGTLLIENAAQILTMAGPNRARVGNELRELGILTDGALFARDDRITAIGPTRDVVRYAERDTVRIDASGCVLAPGFVDAHTHPVFAGTRVAEFELRVL